MNIFKFLSGLWARAFKRRRADTVRLTEAWVNHSEVENARLRSENESLRSESLQSRQQFSVGGRWYRTVAGGSVLYEIRDPCDSLSDLALQCQQTLSDRVLDAEMWVAVKEMALGEAENERDRLGREVKRCARRARAA